MSGELLTGGVPSGDWSLDGNWSSAAKPVDDDDAIIPPELPFNVSMSLDESDVDLDLLRVHSGFTGTVGTGASPIQLAADFLEVFGSSGFYMESGDDGVDTHTTDTTLIQTPNANTPVELGTKVGSNLGDWGRIIIDRGTVTLKANILFAANGEIVMNSDAATAILTAGADTLTTLYLNAGTVVSDSPITVAHLKGGQMTQDTALATTVFVYGGARYVMNHSAATNIIVHSGGTLDLLNNSIKKTVSNLLLYPGANIIWDPGASPLGPGGLHTVGTLLHDWRQRSVA